jgi:hypothetical protein
LPFPRTHSAPRLDSDLLGNFHSHDAERSEAQALKGNMRGNGITLRAAIRSGCDPELADPGRASGTRIVDRDATVPDLVMFGLLICEPRRRAASASSPPT